MLFQYFASLETQLSVLIFYYHESIFRAFWTCTLIELQSLGGLIYPAVFSFLLAKRKPITVFIIEGKL